jgi:hypothetical protein
MHMQAEQGFKGGRDAAIDAVKNALLPLIDEGEVLIWRGASRWMCPQGVLPNHFEVMSAEDVCTTFYYQLVQDFGDVAIVRPLRISARDITRPTPNIGPASVLDRLTDWCANPFHSAR